MHTQNLQIREVTDKQALDAFIRLPWKLYKDDPHWIPPLLMERKEALSDKNPFFEHARWKAWLAYRGDELVGRISAQIDDLHQQRYQNHTGFFGLLEAIEDPAVFAALFETAEAWLKAEGMQQVSGPFNLGINQEIGILVDGFDSPPYVMNPHSLPYYDQQIKNCNYRPEQELLAYEVGTNEVEVPKLMQRLLRNHAHRITVTAFNKKDKDQQLELMRDIFNDAWQNNWNFVPFTKAEFTAIGKELLMLLPTDFIQIAEVDGQAAAFIVMIPNVNEAAADLNGRLLPFGWAKLLWRLKVRFPKTARVALMGVRQQYQQTQLGPALAFMVVRKIMDTGFAHGLDKVEMSWILEQNQGMRHMIESLKGYISKRYRMYTKSLN